MACVTLRGHVQWGPVGAPHECGRYARQMIAPWMRHRVEDEEWQLILIVAANANTKPCCCPAGSDQETVMKRQSMRLSCSKVNRGLAM